MVQKVLIIDDSKTVHSVVKSKLSDEPIEFHSGFTGRAGLELAAALQPDLILLDVELPDLNGFEVCRLLKADPKTMIIPVIFLTGASTTEEKIKGLRLGAVDYVTKPFDVAELLARVGASLRTKFLIDLLAAQHAATRALSESETLAEATPRIVKAICESLDWDLGIIWEVDQQTAMLTLVSAWHSHRVQAPEFKEVTSQTRLGRGVGLPGIVWEKAKPNWIPDVLKEPNFHRDRFTAKTGLHGAIAFPLQSSKEVVGVIEFLNRQVEEVDNDLLNMLCAIGSQIGQFAERKRAEKVQAATYRAAEAANAAPGLEDLFRLTHTIVADLMPAKNFYVALYERDSGVLSFRYFIDEYDPTPAPRKLKNGLTEYVLRTGKPLLHHQQCSRG